MQFGQSIDICAVNGLSSMQKWRWVNASLLYEVPGQSGNQGPEIYHDEEQEAGYSGCMPQVRHQGFQNWEGLEPELSEP